MITRAKVKVFCSFQDADEWARLATKKQKEGIADADWSLIEGFVQDIQLVKKGFASKDFLDALEKRLLENCDSAETITFLKEIAEHELD